MPIALKEVGKLFLGSYARVAANTDQEALQLLNGGQLVAGAPVLEAAACYPYDETDEERLFIPSDLLSRAEWYDWAGAFTHCADSYASHSGGVVRSVLNHTPLAHSALFVVYAADSWVHGNPDDRSLVTGEDWRLLAFLETLPGPAGTSVRGRELALMAIGDQNGNTEKLMRFRIEQPALYVDNPVVHPDLLAAFQRLTDALAERHLISFDPLLDATEPVQLDFGDS